MKGKLVDIVLIIVAWLMALSLLYLFIIKLGLLKHIFH